MFDSFVTKLNGKAIFHIERICSMRSKKKKMNKKKKKKRQTRKENKIVRGSNHTTLLDYTIDFNM